MRLANRTTYDTKALQRLIHTVHRVVAKTEGRLPTWRSLRVTVETRRSRRYNVVSGRASLGGGWMLLRLGNPRGWTGPARAHDVAWLIEHELYHSYGRRHGRFREESPEWWAQHVGRDPLPLAPAPSRPRRDLVAERKARAEQLLARWQRKLKLAQTKVKQYRQRVRYYARTAATRSEAARQAVRAEAGANDGAATPSPGPRSLS
jgi:hypothetical protein